MLCLNHSFLGNVGIKDHDADYLRFTDMFISFLSVIFQKYKRVLSLYRFCTLIWLFLEINDHKQI